MVLHIRESPLRLRRVLRLPAFEGLPRSACGAIAMGHIRLGRLPKTLRWQGVVGLLDHSPDDVPAIARATVTAAETRLRELSHDPSLVYCFWVLTRLTAASREADFAGATAALGFPPPDVDSALAFIARVNERVRAELRDYPESGPFSELASLALRHALSETVGQHGRSLFGSSLDDVQQAFRSHATAARFGDLARRFFGDYLARTMHFFVDKELSNVVGAGHGLPDIDASHEFSAALDTYARQSARIMEQFAAGWYGKHNWEARGAISREEAQGFVAVALRKLRMELIQADR